MAEELLVVADAGDNVCVECGVERTETYPDPDCPGTVLHKPRYPECEEDDGL